jgi:predicted metal-dependent hydrolase
MKRNVRLGDRNIEYELTIKKVKNINLRIKADGSIWVSANKNVPIPIIENFILSKRDFILSALERFSKQDIRPIKAREYFDGETVRILGKEYVLRIDEGKINKVLPFFDDGYVKLTVKDINNAELCQKTFEKWQRELCRGLVTELCRKTYDNNSVFAKKGIPFPALHFKTMKTRWGSCNSSGGSLNFNYLLISAPMECIEYVVMHEFTHFLHPNHSRDFYNALAGFMPDWKERKAILNGKQG